MATAPRELVIARFILAAEKEEAEAAARADAESERSARAPSDTIDDSFVELTASGNIGNGNNTGGDAALTWIREHVDAERSDSAWWSPPTPDDFKRVNLSCDFGDVVVRSALVQWWLDLLVCARLVHPSFAFESEG